MFKFMWTYKDFFTVKTLRLPACQLTNRPLVTFIHLNQKLAIVVVILIARLTVILKFSYLCYYGVSIKFKTLK